MFTFFSRRYFFLKKRLTSRQSIIKTIKMEYNGTGLVFVNNDGNQDHYCLRIGNDNKGRKADN